MAQVKWLKNGAEVTRGEVSSHLQYFSQGTPEAIEKQLREMHHEAVICGLSEGLRSGNGVFKCELIDASDIERESMSPSGHYFGCSVFECTGEGCTLPPGHCDCGFETK